MPPKDVAHPCYHPRAMIELLSRRSESDFCGLALRFRRKLDMPTPDRSATKEQEEGGALWVYFDSAVHSHVLWHRASDSRGFRRGFEKSRRLGVRVLCQPAGDAGPALRRGRGEWGWSSSCRRRALRHLEIADLIGRGAAAKTPGVGI